MSEVLDCIKSIEKHTGIEWTKEYLRLGGRIHVVGACQAISTVTCCRAVCQYFVSALRVVRGSH